METGISTRRQTEHARSQSDGHRSETETVPAKPWASGRTLTHAQRERKRALDRQSHRERRDKVQSRIAELEALVNALLGERADKGNGTETSIENQAPDTTSQGLGHVPGLTFTSSNLQEFVASGSDIFSNPGASVGACFADNIMCGPPDYNSTIDQANALNSQNEVVSATPQGLLTSNVGQLFQKMPAAECMQTDSPTIYIAPVQPVIVRDSISTTQLCNIELNKANQLTANQVCQGELANQDSIVTAVLQGWETIERRGYVCPLWKILHRIDDLLFCRSSTITRLVMLYTIHRMLLCCVRAKSVTDLPPWYRPRPAQCRFQHEAVMGYFAWPGLRERLVLSEKAILGEFFWNIFAQYFRFNWPYDLANVYNVNSTGQVHFSGAFMNYLHDIRHWQMDHRFFAEFPEISNDIYPAPALPMRITFPESSMMATRDSPVGSAVESAEDTASENLCDVPSSLPNPIIPPDPWNLSQSDFAMEITPAWDQANNNFPGPSS